MTDTQPVAHIVRAEKMAELSEGNKTRVVALCGRYVVRSMLDPEAAVCRRCFDIYMADMAGEFKGAKVGE